MEALNEVGRGGASVTRRRLGNPLIVAQVALSVMLLVGAGLFVRTFASLASLDLGFDRDPLLLVTLDAQRSGVAPADRHALYMRTRDAVATLPGVERVAVSILTPLSGMSWNDAIEVEGQPALKGRDRMAWFNAVTPGWFATYGTPLVAGRDFDSRDRTGSTLVAVVNEAFARRFVPGASPVGKSIRLPDHDVGQPTKVSRSSASWATACTTTCARSPSPSSIRASHRAATRTSRFQRSRSEWPTGNRRRS